MAGHNKWSKIKRKKGAADAKRGQVFTKLIKEITVAARMGGGDPNANARLRAAIDAARAENMPKDNVERAIKKGTGELEGAAIEEIALEGYGPGGAALLIECLSDNRNRTVADVRAALNKGGGSMGEAGSVAWNFDKKGFLSVEKNSISEDALMETALEAGAEDIQDSGDTFDVITPWEQFSDVKDALDGKGVSYLVAQVSQLPKTIVPLAGDEARKMLTLVERLEDLDDVQHVWGNFDIDEAIIEEMSA